MAVDRGNECKRGCGKITFRR